MEIGVEGLKETAEFMAAEGYPCTASTLRDAAAEIERLSAKPVGVNVGADLKRLFELLDYQEDNDDGEPGRHVLITCTRLHVRAELDAVLGRLKNAVGADVGASDDQATPSA